MIFVVRHKMVARQALKQGITILAFVTRRKGIASWSRTMLIWATKLEEFSWILGWKKQRVEAVVSGRLWQLGVQRSLFQDLPCMTGAFHEIWLVQLDSGNECNWSAVTSVFGREIPWLKALYELWDVMTSILHHCFPTFPAKRGRCVWRHYITFGFSKSHVFLRSQNLSSACRFLCRHNGFEC